MRMASNMIYPPVWMWVVAVVLLVVGGLVSFVRQGRGYPPTWVCGFLALGAVIGMWFLLNAQFGGQVMQFHLP